MVLPSRAPPRGGRADTVAMLKACECHAVLLEHLRDIAARVSAIDTSLVVPCDACGRLVLLSLEGDPHIDSTEGAPSFITCAQCGFLTVLHDARLHSLVPGMPSPQALSILISSVTCNVKACAFHGSNARLLASAQCRAATGWQAIGVDGRGSRHGNDSKGASRVTRLRYEHAALSC